MNKGWIFFYIFLFVLLRLPVGLFTHYPFWGIDSTTYGLWQSGGWPIFDRRLPVYPIVVETIFNLTGRLIWITLLQSALALFISVRYLWLINKVHPKQFIYHLVFVAFCFYNPVIIFYEMSVLSESLYFSLLFLLFQTLYFAFYTNHNRSWKLAGILCMLLLLTKQAALFLVPVIAIVAGYKIYKKAYWQLRMLLVPPVVGVFMFMLYNFASFGKFTYSPFGGLNLLGTAVMYMDTSASYPAPINSCIANYNANLPANDLATIKTANYWWTLRVMFNKHYNDCWKMNECFIQSNSLPFKHSALATYDKICYDIAISAIKRSPLLYAKFFYCMVLNYFQTATVPYKFEQMLEENQCEKYDAYHALKSWLFGTGRPASIAMLYDVTKSNTTNYAVPDSFGWFIGLINNISKLCYSLYWELLQFALLLFLGYKFLKEKMLQPAYAIFILLGLANILNGVGTALVEETFVRYSCPFFFSYYYACVVIPLLFIEYKTAK